MHSVVLKSTRAAELYKYAILRNVQGSVSSDTLNVQWRVVLVSWKDVI